MPGKVNPVILESLTVVVAQVVGNDATIGFARRAACSSSTSCCRVPRSPCWSRSIALLGAAAAQLRGPLRRRDRGDDRGPALVEQGLMLATALAPVIGYDAGAALAKDAFKSGRTIRELARERGLAERGSMSSSTRPA